MPYLQESTEICYMEIGFISARKAQGEIFQSRYAIKFINETGCVFAFELCQSIQIFDFDAIKVQSVYFCHP